MLFCWFSQMVDIEYTAYTKQSRRNTAYFYA
nr:MAG TPA: hypothetical protein [Caudoviricetes sp.]